MKYPIYEIYTIVYEPIEYCGQNEEYTQPFHNFRFNAFIHYLPPNIYLISQTRNYYELNSH